jgi:hypothetical protein
MMPFDILRIKPAPSLRSARADFEHLEGRLVQGAILFEFAAAHAGALSFRDAEFP